MVRSSPGGDEILFGEILVVAVAGIACRHDNHDARPDQPGNLDTQRALSAREPFRIERIPDGQVHAVDLEIASVGVDLVDVMQRSHDRALIPVATVIEDPIADQLAHGRNTGHLVDLLDAVGDVVVLVALGPHHLRVVRYARDDPRHVGAVAVPVGRRRGLARQVGEVAVYERRGHVQVAVLREMRVVGLDTRIEYRPDDVLSGGGKRRARCGGLDGVSGLVDQRVGFEVGPDSVDRRRRMAPVELNDPANRCDRQPREDVLPVAIARDLTFALPGLGFCLVDVIADRGRRAVESQGVPEVEVDHHRKHFRRLRLAHAFQQRNGDDRAVKVAGIESGITRTWHKGHNASAFDEPQG